MQMRKPLWVRPGGLPCYCPVSVALSSALTQRAIDQTRKSLRSPHLACSSAGGRRKLGLLKTAALVESMMGAVLGPFGNAPFPIPRSSNRTRPIKASGSPTGFTVRPRRCRTADKTEKFPPPHASPYARETNNRYYGSAWSRGAVAVLRGTHLWVRKMRTWPD